MQHSVYMYCGCNLLNSYLLTNLLSIPFNKFPCLFVIFCRHFGQVLVPLSSHFWMHSSWIRWPHWVETVFFSELNDSKHTGHFMFFLDARLFFFTSYLVIGNRLILFTQFNCEWRHNKTNECRADGDLADDTVLSQIKKVSTHNLSSHQEIC